MSNPLADLLGEAALDLFIKPQINNFVQGQVTAGNIPAAKAAEMEAGLMDVIEDGLNMALKARAQPPPAPPSP